MKKVLEIYQGTNDTKLWRKDYTTVYHLFGKSEEVSEQEVTIASPLEAIVFLANLIKMDSRFGIRVEETFSIYGTQVDIKITVTEKDTLRKLVQLNLL